MAERCRWAQPQRVRQRLEQLAGLVSGVDERVYQIQSTSDAYTRSLHELEARTKDAERRVEETRRNREKSDRDPTGLQRLGNAFFDQHVAGLAAKMRRVELQLDELRVAAMSVQERGGGHAGAGAAATPADMRLIMEQQVHALEVIAGHVSIQHERTLHLKEDFLRRKGARRVQAGGNQTFSQGVDPLDATSRSLAGKFAEPTREEAEKIKIIKTVQVRSLRGHRGARVAAPEGPAHRALRCKDPPSFLPSRKRPRSRRRPIPASSHPLLPSLCRTPNLKKIENTTKRKPRSTLA